MLIRRTSSRAKLLGDFIFDNLTIRRLEKAGLPKRYFGIMQIAPENIPALMNPEDDTELLQKILGDVQDELNSSEPSDEILQEKVDALISLMAPPEREPGGISASEIPCMYDVYHR